LPFGPSVGEEGEEKNNNKKNMPTFELGVHAAVAKKGSSFCVTVETASPPPCFSIEKKKHLTASQFP